MVNEQVCFSPDFDREANELLAEISMAQESDARTRAHSQSLREMEERLA